MEEELAIKYLVEGDKAVINANKGIVNSFKELTNMQKRVGTFGADAILKDFKKLETGLINWGTLANKYGVQDKDKFEQGLVPLAEHTKGLKILTQQEDIARKQAKKFKMEYLGIMFLGMQLQRTFGGLFKDIINQYKQLKDSTSPLNQALTRLEANFIFLKYSIAEAMGPLLTGIIDGIVNFVRQLSYMDPDQLKKIGIAIAGLAGLGALFFTWGQAALGIQALNRVLFGESGLLTKLDSLKPVSFSSFLSGFTLALLIFEGIKNRWKEVSDSFMDLLSGFGDLFSGALSGNIPKIIRGLLKIYITIQDIGMQILLGIAEFLGNILMNLAASLAGNFKAMLKTFSDYWKIFIDGIKRIMSGESITKVISDSFKANVAVTKSNYENSLKEAFDVKGGFADELANNFDVIAERIHESNKKIYDNDFLNNMVNIVDGVKTSTNEMAKTVQQQVASQENENSLVSSYNKAGEASIKNLVTIPKEQLPEITKINDSVALSVGDIKTAIDSIPETSVKTIIIKTIYM